MTINLYISKEALPEGFAEMWCPEDAKIVFDYVEEISEEDEKTEEDNDDKKDEDDKQNGGFWG